YGDGRAHGSPPDGEEAWEAVVDEIKLRSADLELGCDRVGARAQDGILGEREWSRAEHPEEGTVPVRVHAGCRQQRAEGEQERGRRAPYEPPGTRERARENGHEGGSLQDVQRDRSRHGLRVSGVVLDEPARG